ncbi:unnamed protein product [Microthlaspi erraticum]|uniref:J domain-containing protein n=1 Tax=Microthlaspi erraticum TaxID=1685480 RepID=A0A6D2IVK6_9BRAS|nr:unnamed protein product [Microthlaspi erraticum]
MEYNKEEATRAREIAKKKFLANDLPGARKFAMKAQFMYPELEGIAQMAATFDVHVSAKNIIYGEIDHYGVLGVNPEADDETVRRRYRKLAVLLHPDKNKSVGAEEAFKFLSQAWGVFSDKAKRADYNMKRNLGMHNKGRGASTTSSSSQRVVNTTKLKTSSKRGIKRASEASASASGVAAAAATSTAAAGGGTFWTVCRTCKTQYEYHRIYLNQNLLCPNCRKPFIAVETDPPGSGSIRKTFNEHQFDSIRQATTDGRKKSRDGGNGVYGGEYDSFEWSGVYTGGAKNPTHAPPRKDEVVRREYTKRAPGVSMANAPKRRKGLENGVAAGSNTAGGFAAKSNTVKELSEEDIKNVLKKKVKPLVRRKLQELCMAVPETAIDEHGRRLVAEDLDGDNAAIESSSVDSILDSDKVLNSLEDLTVDVLEPDFCDFDKDRSEKSFADDEIWACYDSIEGMPRSYVMIEKVISVEPFKVRIVRLTSETKSELRSTRWLGFGIAKTCGDFRVGKTQTCKTPYVFSHRVKVGKGSQGEFLIYPRKGEVWALYKNWSLDWNYLRECERVEYDLVEVVEGYTEEYGVSVVPLVKVAGFKSVFHHHLDANEVRRILKDEISRFSHRIPSYLLTGREATDAPRGCRQLDPAATPSELLQVIDYHL